VIFLMNVDRLYVHYYIDDIERAELIMNMFMKVWA